MSQYQATICEPITFEGIGIHSGVNSKITLNPAPVNTGIVFRTPEGYHVDASIRNVAPSKSGLCTTLVCERYTDRTSHPLYIMQIEHLMAALKLCGVTNCIIDVHGIPNVDRQIEMPILCGSAWQFITGIMSQYNANQDLRNVQGDYRRKIITQAALTPRPLIMNKEIIVSDEDDDAYIKIEPNPESEGFDIYATINFTHRAPKTIGEQTNSVFMPINRSRPDIALQCSTGSARTFGFYEDMERLHQLGRARGAGFENCLVVSEKEDCVIGSLPPRSRGEFVQHKILDIIGDFALLGAPIKGKIIAYKPSHRLSQELVRRLHEEYYNKFGVRI